jgi:hypothetical protein
MFRSNKKEIFFAHAADLGRVAFLATSILIAVTLALELLAPGIAGNVVSPQKLVFAAVVAGAMSLLASRQTRSAGWRTAALAVAALILTVIAFSSALRYFDSITMALIMALCIVLPFLAYAKKDAE